MATARYSADDYRSALQNLFPRGRVWPRDTDATQSKVTLALAKCYERSDAAANQLLDDAFPKTALSMLPEWESALGLPSACTGVLSTLQARRDQIVNRFASLGGQSIVYMIAFAEMLGFTITITQFAPARAGLLRAGQPCNGVAWAHAWQVNTLINMTRPFRVGYSLAGEPLSSSGSTLLACEMAKVSPAHTTLIFNFF